MDTEPHRTKFGQGSSGFADRRHEHSELVRIARKLNELQRSCKSETFRAWSKSKTVSSSTLLYEVNQLRKRVYIKKFFYSIFVLLVSCGFVRAEEYSCLYGNFDPSMTAKEYCNNTYKKIIKLGQQNKIQKLGLTTEQWFQVCETSYNANKQEYDEGYCYKIIKTGETFYRNGKKCEKIKTKEYNMQGFECEDGYSEFVGEFGSR